jgi:hypothetical protein
MLLSWVIHIENSDGSMPPTEGHEGNLLVWTQIQSMMVSRPLDGAPDMPASGHPLCHLVIRSGPSWLL